MKAETNTDQGFEKSSYQHDQNESVSWELNLYNFDKKI